MSRLSRWLLFGLGYQVTREQARAIAQEVCELRGLPWLEPIRVHRHYGDWAVWTFADHRGGNVRVILDGETGDVRQVTGPTPR
jgi:hypothetical protein